MATATAAFPADALRPIARTGDDHAYAQIADQIREIIRSEQLQPGVRLPAQNELAERFGVSLMTLREGIRVLRDAGLVRVEHGVGIFIEITVDELDDAAPDDALFTLADVGLEITPTEAMRRGTQVVHQCAWCGAVVVWHKDAWRPALGVCPACCRDAGGGETGSSGWWRQRLPVAGIREHDHDWRVVGAMQICEICTRMRPIPLEERATTTPLTTQENQP